MVYTNKLLVFTRLGTDEIADIVPLKEILTVYGIEESNIEVDPFSTFTDKGEDDADDAKCVLGINTVPDGYNSGRVYKIRVISKKHQQTIIKDLTGSSAREREKTEAKSKLKKMQDKIAVVIDSSLVQSFLAFLITVVRLCDGHC